MNGRTILTVEDDAAIRRGIADACRYAGYHVLEAADGKAGLEMALHQAYDLLLLDLVLPVRGGLEILQQLRQSRPTQPVIILTARGEEDDRVAGLRLGADDYVVKPFSVKELLARVEAVLRRSAERPTQLTLVSIPGGEIDLARREIRFDDGQLSNLSQREAELLGYLAANAQRAISREELLSSVWQLNPQGLSTRTIDMHIARLREKLNDNTADPQVLRTVRGRGYMFGSPQTVESTSRPAS